MLTADRRHQTTTSEPHPIWMAALVASGCEAMGRDGARKVDWRCISGRAVYTNRGAAAEVILPFNLAVQQGETIVVSWHPGETSYTVELRGRDCLAA